MECPSFLQSLSSFDKCSPVASATEPSRADKLANKKLTNSQECRKVRPANLAGRAIKSPSSEISHYSISDPPAKKFILPENPQHAGGSMLSN